VDFWQWSQADLSGWEIKKSKDVDTFEFVKTKSPCMHIFGDKTSSWKIWNEVPGW
jgi:hypothetical protein